MQHESLPDIARIINKNTPSFVSCITLFYKKMSQFLVHIKL